MKTYCSVDKLLMLVLRHLFQIPLSILNRQLRVNLLARADIAGKKRNENVNFSLKAELRFPNKSELFSSINGDP